MNRREFFAAIAGAYAAVRHPQKFVTTGCGPDVPPLEVSFEPTSEQLGELINNANTTASFNFWRNKHTSSCEPLTYEQLKRIAST